MASLMEHLLQQLHVMEAALEEKPYAVTSLIRLSNQFQSGSIYQGCHVPLFRRTLLRRPSYTCAAPRGIDRLDLCFHETGIELLCQNEQMINPPLKLPYLMGYLCEREYVCENDGHTFSPVTELKIKDDQILVTFYGIKPLKISNKMRTEDFLVIKK